MSADHLEFLKSKFMEDLRDAEEEHTGENEIPLHSRFLQIRDVLQDKRFTPSTPIRTKDCLYNAIGALEECVILSAKREPRKKDDPLHGYTLAELWLLFRTKKLLLKIKKKLVNTRKDVVESSLASTSAIAAASSSSTSLPVFIPRPNDLDWEYRWRNTCFDEQEDEIIDELVDGKKWGKGLIGIVGIGGSGKTTLAQLVFTNHKVVDFFHYRIWICLSQKLNARDGDENLKEMVREMMKQCADVEESKDKYDRLQDVDEDALLENLKSVLMGNKYLMVFDGIWDIKMDWYLKLGDKLEWFDNHKVKQRERERESSAGVIITTRLPHIPKQMGMPLHHMAPPSPTTFLYERSLKDAGFATKEAQKMEDDIIQQCDGLPLAAEILSKIIPNQILGDSYKILHQFFLVAMVNSEDDAILGKDFFLQLHDLTDDDVDKVVDVSKLPLLDMLEILNQHTYLTERVMKDKYKKTLKLLKNHTPTHANITNVSLFLQKVYAAEERLIDSWDFLMRMTMIPNSLLQAFSYPSTSEADLTHMGGYKEFRTTFWSYFIIGMDDREWFASSSHEKKDEVFTNSCCKSWPRHASDVGLMFYP